MKSCEHVRSFGIQRFILTVLAALACAVASASDGDLDLAFANQGGLYWDYGAYFDGYPGDQARTVLAQPDGSLVAISDVFERSSAGAFYGIGVTRLMADGSFDASFGDPITPGQILLTPAAGDPNQSWYAAAAVLSADGSIVMSGSVAPDFYNANSQAAAWRLTPWSEFVSVAGRWSGAVLLQFAVVRCAVFLRHEFALPDRVGFVCRAVVGVSFAGDHGGVRFHFESRCKLWRWWGQLLRVRFQHCRRAELCYSDGDGI
jgi:hypothetical protein